MELKSIEMRTDLLAWAVYALLPVLASSAVQRHHGRDAQRCQTYSLDGRIHVDCSDLGLTEMPEGLNYHAQVMDLSKNNFVTFPTELEYYLRIEELDLSGNHLSGELPSFISKWDYLHTLNLSNNNFETWGNYGLGPSITKLDLSKNKINTIDDDAFSTITSLHILDLSENRLYVIPSKIFSESFNLDRLVLSRNYFSSIPDFHSASIRSLDLSSCQIASLEATSLAEKSSLLEINLSINQIEYIPDNFESDTLQELDISYNGIQSLTERTFLSLPHLAVLDLRGNDFKEVWSTSFFSSNPFLREILVKGNRWSCDGFSVDLLLTYEYFTREPAKVGDKASLMCYSPANVTQLSWQEAYIQTWHYSDGYETFTFMAVLIGIIIGVIITSAICRGMSSWNKPDPPRVDPTTVNLNGSNTRPQPRVDSVVLRIPLRDDLPPSYDEALLMPTLNSSFHSLPNFIDEEESDHRRRFRRSRSIGDLVDSRQRPSERRSVRPHHTVEINID